MITNIMFVFTAFELNAVPLCAPTLPAREPLEVTLDSSIEAALPEADDTPAAPGPETSAETEAETPTEEEPIVEEPIVDDATEASDAEDY